MVTNPANHSPRRELSGAQLHIPLERVTLNMLLTYTLSYKLKDVEGHRTARTAPYPQLSYHLRANAFAYVPNLPVGCEIQKDTAQHACCTAYLCALLYYACMHAPAAYRRTTFTLLAAQASAHAPHLLSQDAAQIYYRRTQHRRP